MGNELNNIPEARGKLLEFSEALKELAKKIDSKDAAKIAIGLAAIGGIIAALEKVLKSMNGN